MITREEYHELKWLERRIEAGGNDGPDIWEYQEYCRRLQSEYGKPVAELESEFCKRIAA